MTTSGTDRQLKLFWWTVAIVTVFRIFLAQRLGLSDDEAYYWEWSRYLDWSYFDHPGAVAWLIRLSTEVFGHTPFAVRLPALALNTASWILLVRLTQSVFDKGSGIVAGYLFLLVPLYSLGGLMMVPDIPMMFCWMLFLKLTWSKLLPLEKGQKNTLVWLSLGLLMGLGFLSKYSMILAGFSLGLLVLFQKPWRWHLFTWGPWLGLLTFLCVSLPVWIWNWQRGWPSFYFQFVDRHQSQGIQATKYLEFWAGQLGILTPGVFVSLGIVLVAAMKLKGDRRFIFLKYFSLPTLILFSVQALFSEFKIHWTAPGYATLIMGLGYFWANDNLKKNFKYSILIFVLPINLLFFTAMVYPIAPKIHSLFSSGEFDPRWDPTNDLYGHDEIAAHITNLQKSFDSPHVLVTHRYQLSSPMAFVTGEAVYTFSWGLDQYDFMDWSWNLKELVGRNALVIGDNRFEDDLHKRDDSHNPEGIEFEEDMRRKNHFQSCQPLPQLEIRRKGSLARTLYFWDCRGIKEFKTPYDSFLPLANSPQHGGT